MTTRPLRTLSALAADQFGLVTCAQARGADVSDGQIKRLVAAGLVDRPHRGVLRLTTVAPTWDQAMCGVLLRSGGEAVASGRGAGRMFALEGSDRWPVELTVPPGARPRGLRAIVHESGDLAPQDITCRRGMRVTTPTRTLVDLGASVTESALEIALDDALRRGLTTVAKLDESIERLARRGRPGVRHLRRLLGDRAGVDAVTETGFETVVLRVLRRAGLPLPVPQHVIRDDAGTFVMRADLAYPRALLAIEADSERWHMNRRRFQDDRAKRATAESLGWRVLAFTYQQAVSRPDFVSTTVARALEAAGPNFVELRADTA